MYPPGAMARTSASARDAVRPTPKPRSTVNEVGFMDLLQGVLRRSRRDEIREVLEPRLRGPDDVADAHDRPGCVETRAQEPCEFGGRGVPCVGDPGSVDAVLASAAGHRPG